MHRATGARSGARYKQPTRKRTVRNSIHLADAVGAVDVGLREVAAAVARGGRGQRRKGARRAAQTRQT